MIDTKIENDSNVVSMFGSGTNEPIPNASNPFTIEVLRLLVTMLPEKYGEPRHWAAQRYSEENCGMMYFGTKYIGEIDDVVSVVIKVSDRITDRM